MNAPAPYGLLGRTLGHSWSPQIHAQLGSVPYALHEVEPEDVEKFVRQGGWRGLNVTIPYKRKAAELADEVSDRVAALGVANTLVRREDGTIFAENTDVLGFTWLLERFCAERLSCPATELAGKSVLVLGSGGASQAIQASLEGFGASASVISRSGEDTYETLAERHADAFLIVNTTPVGMYPNCPATPVDQPTLAKLKQVKGVIDVIYNPERTGLCLAAEALGIPFESGLAMLVGQAVYSSELFQGKELDRDLIPTIVRRISRETRNIVLIGMPGSGKTSTGKRLARMLGRPFVDIDDAIAQEEGRTAAEIIRSDGEDAFRRVETRVTSAYASRSGLVISCGGGVVTRPENYAPLHQNATIVLVDRPIDELSCAGRPLSQANGVHALAERRMPLYRSWADVTLRCTGSAAGDAALALDLLHLS